MYTPADEPTTRKDLPTPVGVFLTSAASPTLWESFLELHHLPRLWESLWSLDHPAPVGVLRSSKHPHSVGVLSQPWRSAIARPMPPQIALDPGPDLPPWPLARLPWRG